MPNIQTTRELDVILEQSVAKFADTYFYSKLKSEKNINVQRVNDKTLQMEGVDLLIDGLAIDEKVKVKGGFISKVLQYPSFEVSFRRRNDREVVDGWFVKDGLKTDYYCMISVFADLEDWKQIRFENIDKLLMLFIHKKELMQYLSLNIERLKRLSDELRKNPTEDGRMKVDANKQPYLKISLQYPEEPVNLVVRRDEILRLKMTKEVEVSKKMWMTVI